VQAAEVQRQRQNPLRSWSMEQQKVTNGARVPGVDIGIASLFNTQIAMIHLEQQALWQRYTAILVAEAILVGSFGWVQAPTALQVYFASGFGLALCLAWLVTTVSGYKLWVTRLDEASHFALMYLARFDDYDTPVVGSQWLYRRKHGWILWMALCIIALFMLAHAFVLVHYLYYRFLFFEGPR
jgi:hypothetical protein